MGVLSKGRKPVGKVELGKMRILFWGLKRKMTKKMEGKDMVGARASLDEEEGSDGASLLEASMEVDHEISK
nr:hypothetical protein Iba_chr10fCG5920 [Ipomoea batatas]